MTATVSSTESGPVFDYLTESGARKIRASGDNLISCCPFHDDSHRSFSINTQTGKFICFSESCGVQGGLRRFLTEACGYSDTRAKEIAEEFGESVETQAIIRGGWPEIPDWQNRGDHSLLREEREALVGLYALCPKYLLGRGFTKKTLQHWEIGYDREAKRVTLAVRDEHGRLVGFTKRATRHVEEAKYLHLGFKKSHVLYGAHLVPKKHRGVWVGEGQLDAVALYQMGLPSGYFAVSTLGARVSPTHIKALKGFRDVVLAFDDDSDGRRATEKVAESFLDDGRIVSVAHRFPAGCKDPAEVLEKKPSKFRRFLDTTPWDEVRLSWG